MLEAGRATGASRAALWIVAGLCIQARLICNLLDGLVAVEHGRGGPCGPLWNELPDRLADALFLIAAGYGGVVGRSMGCGAFGVACRSFGGFDSLHPGSLVAGWDWPPISPDLEPSLREWLS